MRRDQHPGPSPGPLATSARLGALGALLIGSSCLAVALAAPVAALERDDGDDPGGQMSKLEVLLVFGVIPLGIVLLISLLVALPSLLKGQRKLGSWDAQPEWYGGPTEGTPEVAGHGEQAELTGRVVTTGADGGEADGGDGGGSSARW